MTIPDELRYTAEHEWVSISGSVASVGITDYAQQALGDVVYVSVPAPGSRVTAGEPCGEVESTKSVSDIYAPVDGEVTEVNGDLEDDPADAYQARPRYRRARPADPRRVRRADQGIRVIRAAEAPAGPPGSTVSGTR